MQGTLSALIRCREVLWSLEVAHVMRLGKTVKRICREVETNLRICNQRQKRGAARPIDTGILRFAILELCLEPVPDTGNRRRLTPAPRRVAALDTLRRSATHPDRDRRL